MAAETKERRKKSKEKVEETAAASPSIISRIRTYISEVRSELLKVSWPDREEVIKLTRIVLLVTIISSLLLGALSLALTLLVEYGVNMPIIFIVIFAGIILGTVYMFRRGNQKVSY